MTKPDLMRNGEYHGRLYASYKRQPGRRLPGRSTLIVCEGGQTEPNYFQNLRRYFKISSNLLKIVSQNGGAPLALVEEAKKQVEIRNAEVRRGRVNLLNFEIVWCVFDTENINVNPTFNAAVQLAESRKFSLAISNPAFEYWYILHFENTNRPFANGKETKEYLKKYIHNYEESMNVFPQLVDSTSSAISRAAGCFANYCSDNTRFPNPSTQVYCLVDQVMRMSPSGRNYE